MTNYYILTDQNETKPASLHDWAMFFESGRRHVASDVFDDVRVSTVFLGIDHRFGDGPPLLFETMIFGGEHDGYQERCSTYDEALAMHKAACAMLRNPHH